MSGTNEEREKQIEDLNTFIQMTQERLNNIVSGLGWTLESISKQSQNTVTCPFNNGHRIIEKSLENHLEKCQWKAEGYREDELPLSEPCPSVNSSSAIKFDEQLQDTVLLKAREENPTMCTEIIHCCPWNSLNAIAPAAGLTERLIPRTSDRLMASFTTDERKAIYDYVVANTIKLDIGDDIADMNRLAQKDGNQPKTSLLELLAQERNLKRRRAKHRGVHTNKKSQVEILREVISQQMEMYEEYIADSTIKSEPKSPRGSETNSLDFQASVERKNYQQIKHEAEWPRRSSSKSNSKYFDRPANTQTFLPTKRSPTSDFGLDRDRKRNRSESRESGRKKHHSKHRRDRSKERNREKEEGRRRQHFKEEEPWSREEVYQSEDKTDRRKRHRSRDRGNKYTETSRRSDKSGDKYYRGERKGETDKSRKRKH